MFEKIKMFSYFNNSSNIVYEAGKSCFNGKLSTDYEDIYKFIKSRVKEGHESIIEHTNFFIAAIVPDTYLVNLMEVLSKCRYLNTNTKRIETPNKSIFKKKKNTTQSATLVNIGGSIRGWKHIYRTIENPYNVILKRITEEIYKRVPDAFFEDFINDGIFDIDKFKFINETEFSNKFKSIEDNKKEVDGMLRLINIDYLEDLISTIPADMIISSTLYDMLNITVQFQNMSRVITHQMVRHRDGITQESQRYVDYTDHSIKNPMVYYPDYDKDKTYTLTSNEFITYNKPMTAEELCKAIQPIYGDLHSQGMKAEAARYYMGFGVECGSLIMTFTYRTLAKLFELRMHKSAQGENRVYAKELAYLLLPLLDEGYFLYDQDNISVNTSILDPIYKSYNSDEYNNLSEMYDDIEEDIDEDYFTDSVEGMYDSENEERTE